MLTAYVAGNDSYDGPYFRRASGLVVCPWCKRLYQDHPLGAANLSQIDGQPFLHVLCSGERVKL